MAEQAGPSSSGAEAPATATATANAAPPLLDLTIDNITPNTIRINSQSPDARLTYVMARLVTHLHDFARETRLSTDEWMAAIEFLIACGKICSDVRNVSMLLYSLFFPSTTLRIIISADGGGLNHPGIHPPLGRARAVAARRQHQPPQAAAGDRGLRAGALPHARRAGVAQRGEHDVGPGGRAHAGAVHRQGHGGQPDPRGDGRHLGDGQLGPLRRAACRPRRAERALRHGLRRPGPLLVPRAQTRQLPHPARRARRQAAAAAAAALLATRARALHVWQGRVGSADYVRYFITPITILF